jgi:hypothetical protein
MPIPFYRKEFLTEGNEGNEGGEKPYVPTRDT